jgi:hypothetical protein
MDVMVSNVNIPPPRANRVQAWVYAILNPVIVSVRRELQLLEKGNVSWRFYSKKCEYIRPVAEYIDGNQLPNLEDFLTDFLNEGFKARIDAHDSAVFAVEAAASTFFNGLMRSARFLEDVTKAFDEYKLGAHNKPQYPDPDSIERDLPKYVAEYLINRTELLPSHYLIHKFWEEFRSRFEHSAKEFEPYQQRESFQALKRSVHTLKDTSKELLAALEARRYWLCSTYDIPAAPIPTNMSHGVDANVIRDK